MYLEEIRSLLEKKLSPKIYKLGSEVYGFHYGQMNKEKVVKKVLFTVDLTLDSIHYAIKNKVNLIISNHGLISTPIKKFNSSLINKLSLLSRYPISIFVLNSSFIAVEGGISETIMDMLYLNLDGPFSIKNNTGHTVPIGRICTPKAYIKGEKSMTFEDLLKRVKNNLQMNSITYVGDLNKIISKVCIVGSESFFMGYLKKAIKYECDCFISGAINHSIASYAKDLGLNLIQISHYKCDFLALKKLCNLLSLEFPYDEFIMYNSIDPLSNYS